jgi:hypothetical protein
MATLVLPLLAPAPAVAQSTAPQLCSINRLNTAETARLRTVFRDVQSRRLGEYLVTVEQGQQDCRRQPGAFHVSMEWQLRRNGQWVVVCNNTITEFNRDRVYSLRGAPAGPSCDIGWQ